MKWDPKKWKGKGQIEVRQAYSKWWGFEPSTLVERQLIQSSLDQPLGKV